MSPSLAIPGANVLGASRWASVLRACGVRPILLLREDSSLFLSCPGGGELRQGEGAVGVGINGGWEPEKESASLTERASERAAGLCDLGQVP